MGKMGQAEILIDLRQPKFECSTTTEQCTTSEVMDVKCRPVICQIDFIAQNRKLLLPYNNTPFDAFIHRIS